MTHMEQLICEFLDWQGYIVKSNFCVGKRAAGGWEMELDIVAYHHATKHLVQYEPSIDALSWQKRLQRYEKKFKAGKTYIFTEVFPWLPPDTELHQIAVFISHPRGRDTIAGGKLVSVDEMMAEVRNKVIQNGPMYKNAIPERYPLLRTIQMVQCGYYKLL